MQTEITYRRNGPEISFLLKNDPVLGSFIESIGDYKLTLRTDYFVSLVRAIIGQQLSIKATDAIWQRLLAQTRRPTPEDILNMAAPSLQAIGISRPKINYLMDLAGKVSTVDINLDGLAALSDARVMETLMTIKGIGKWTAEMFLIFSLGRPDVLSLGDVGLQRSVKWLYQPGEADLVSCLKAIGEKWRPFRTVASLYLWEAINRNLIRRPFGLTIQLKPNKGPCKP